MEGGGAWEGEREVRGGGHMKRERRYECHISDWVGTIINMSCRGCGLL